LHSRSDSRDLRDPAIKRDPPDHVGEQRDLAVASENTACAVFSTEKKERFMKHRFRCDLAIAKENPADAAFSWV
jgi:hypothetical protein